MMNIQDYRLRAVKAVYQKLKSSEDDKLHSWDYTLDGICRQILDLPVRPTSSHPYVGWLAKPASKPTISTTFSTSKPQSISQAGIDLIKRWEGYRSQAYLCPGNIWTIGYGHTKGVRQGQVISQAQAERLLKEDLKYFEKEVDNLVAVPINQAQFDALVSFAFNVGVNALAKSTLLKLLNQKDYAGAASQFGRWVYANKKRLPGLVKRREEEKKLFLS